MFHKSLRIGQFDFADIRFILWDKVYSKIYADFCAIVPFYLICS
jgi:hypothetical protein